MAARVRPTPKKSARKSATGRPFRQGDDPRRGRGPDKGAPNAGRPPDEFKRLMASLAGDDASTLRELRRILANGDHQHFMKAVAHVTDRGYDRAAQPHTGADGVSPIAHSVAVTVTRRIVRPSSKAAA